MLELSYNKASIFRACPMKYRWQYVENIEPITKPVALSLGSVIHEAFDRMFKGSNDDEIVKYISSAFDSEISKAEAVDQEDWLIARYTALGMWMGYPYKDTTKFSDVHSEEAGRVKLCPGVHFVFKLDRRFVQNNVMLIGELKTTSLGYQQFEGKMHTSGQATGYVWGSRQQGNDVKGVLYEYVKKPLLRKGVKEDANQFGTRIMLDYKERPENYYGRCYTFRNEAVLKSFERDMTLLAKTIKRAHKRDEFYRNPDHCWNFNSECPFLKICFQETPDPLTKQLYYKTKEKR